MSQQGPEHLNGWKAIAQHLACSPRTAQRWEAHFGLPVRRIHGPSGATVRAFVHELDEWLESGQGQLAVQATADEVLHRASPTPVASAIRRWRWPLAASVVMGSGLVAVWAGGATEPALDIDCATPCTVRQGGTVHVHLDAGPEAGPYTRWIRGESGRIEAFRPPLHPDHAGRITWGFTTDCTSTPGRYELRLVREADGRMTRGVEVGIEPDSSCGGPVADLLAEGVTLNTTAAQPGERLTVTFTLRNQGQAHAVTSVARLRLGQSPDRTAVTDRFLGDVSAPALPVGASATLHHEVRLPDDLSPGVILFVWAVADNGSAVLERVSTNNFARSAPLHIHPR